MRELIFRAWDDEHKTWVYFSMVQLMSHYDTDQMHNADEDLTWIRGHDWFQFTGILDKNGKEIYEGDILLLPDTDTEHILDDGSGPTNPFNHLAPVVFEMGSFGLKLPSDGDLWDAGFHTFIDLFSEGENETIEVIGNLHENPELLE